MISCPHGPGSRFHYWTGASGARYLFTIFDVDDCPELPGAVYLAARKVPDGAYAPAGIGRMTALAGLTLTAGFRAELTAGGVREIHLHLLAETADMAMAAIADLKAAHRFGYHDGNNHGFGRPARMTPPQAISA